VILFVDGIDGTGKSTLVARLLDDVARLGTPAVVAPPLWTFLEPISAPEDFGPWVRATPGGEVGRHLVKAMTHRVETLHADSIGGPQAIVLVDRGPRTVACSARAQARTGARSEHPDRSVFGTAQRLLEQRVADLLAAVPAVSVELRHHGQFDLVLRRLAAFEQLTQRYLDYLHVFADEMTSSPDWPSVPRVALDAGARVDANADACLAWLKERRPPCRGAADPSFKVGGDSAKGRRHRHAPLGLPVHLAPTGGVAKGAGR